MGTRSTAVLVSGTANTAKLFVAACAFTAAYVGFSAYDTASSAPRDEHTVTLSAREMPMTTPIASSVSPAAPGAVTVAETRSDAGCAKTFRARGVVVNPDPHGTALYTWRLARLGPDGHAWRDYLVDHDGFAGLQESVDWSPRITGNPGWYRVELSVRGAGTVRSRRFQVAC
ncbi:hypothetical protein HTZ77_34715 [Nonomuraea sp. SMC257]|uniref:Uncharacterized protein n=1 Tax=Nonomuraea montanisoli TaxID=2741721 RepID=A0A7Y6IDZ3_9ACTN|nr:hypothetical protein [Nonomuraea montanisoli]NUW36522.1 hypothetical protein [Nonomuraea montanisoli]